MYNKYLKRIFDLAISFCIFPLFLLVYLLVFIAIKIDDKGPILYSGKRLGKDLRMFKMYKFRSMKVNVDDIRNLDGSTYNSKNDSRLTRVGKVIRKLSIDELPQVINVIKGDMSFIGPRPSPIGNEDLYSQEYMRKFSIRPGITGYTQAYYRNSISIENKQKYDLYYVENISFFLDVKVFLRTIVMVVKRKNLYTNDINKSKLEDDYERNS